MKDRRTRVGSLTSLRIYTIYQQRRENESDMQKRSCLLRFSLVCWFKLRAYHNLKSSHMKACSSDITRMNRGEIHGVALQIFIWRTPALLWQLNILNNDNKVRDFNGWPWFQKKKFRHRITLILSIYHTPFSTSDALINLCNMYALVDRQSP